MVDRRGFLVAGAGAAVAAGCGKAAEEPVDQVSERLVTSVQGDIEMLNTLLSQERAIEQRGIVGQQDAEHARRLEQEIRRLKGEPDGFPSATTSGDLVAHKAQTIALYVDAIPKISDEKARRLAAGILVSHGAHLAYLNEDDPAPDAFLYGTPPAA